MIKAFTKHPVKKRGKKTKFLVKPLSLAIGHSFCCILPIMAAIFGVSFFELHNPFVELLLAIVAPIIGVKIHQFIHHCDEHACHTHGMIHKVRPYLLWVTLSLFVMLAHHYFSHDHSFPDYF